MDNVMRNFLLLTRDALNKKSLDMDTWNQLGLWSERCNQLNQLGLWSERFYQLNQ